MNALLFALVVLSYGIAVTQAVQCYDCSYSIITSTGTSCLDEFDGANVPTDSCSGVCQKSYGKINDEITSMTRSCVSSCATGSNGCTGGLGIYACNYCCSGNLCNTAGSVTFSLVVLASAAMVFFALRLVEA